MSCVASNVAQSGLGAGVGGQTWQAAVHKIKSHQVETGIVDRVPARNVRGNERADEYDRWEAEVHAPDGVDAFAVESRCTGYEPKDY